jgi:hypothetical protein
MEIIARELTPSEFPLFEKVWGTIPDRKRIRKRSAYSGYLRTDSSLQQQGLPGTRTETRWTACLPWTNTGKRICTPRGAGPRRFLRCGEDLHPFDAGTDLILQDFRLGPHPGRYAPAVHQGPVYFSASARWRAAMSALWSGRPGNGKA